MVSDDERNAEGAAYERIVERYVPTCPICGTVGRREDHESDAYAWFGGHIRREHPGYVVKRSYKHMIVWEPVAPVETK